jgi:hypothetical protein
MLMFLRLGPWVITWLSTEGDDRERRLPMGPARVGLGGVRVPVPTLFLGGLLGGPGDMGSWYARLVPIVRTNLGFRWCTCGAPYRHKLSVPRASRWYR